MIFDQVWINCYFFILTKINSFSFNICLNTDDKNQKFGEGHVVKIL